MEGSEKDILAPLPLIKNLIIIIKGGAQPILLDKYDEYLNMPLKMVKMSDLINSFRHFWKISFSISKWEKCFKFISKNGSNYSRI